MFLVITGTSNDGGLRVGHSKTSPKDDWRNACGNSEADTGWNISGNTNVDVDLHVVLKLISSEGHSYDSKQPKSFKEDANQVRFNGNYQSVCLVVCLCCVWSPASWNCLVYDV